MITAVDTNILLDILLEDENYYEHSKQLLEESYEKGSLIISPPVYSELLTEFIRRGLKEPRRRLENFLRDLGIGVKNFTRDSLKISAKSWANYVETHSLTKVQCPKCGKKNEFYCEKCGKLINWRMHMITDFLIGGHAQVLANRFLTRDRGYYKNYFEVEIIR